MKEIRYTIDVKPEYFDEYILRFQEFLGDLEEGIEKITIWKNY